MKCNTLLDLVYALKAADRATARQLADDNPEFRASYRSSFVDEIMAAQVAAGISDGALGDNFIGIDRALEIACQWVRACKHCPDVMPVTSPERKE